IDLPAHMAVLRIIDGLPQLAIHRGPIDMILTRHARAFTPGLAALFITLTHGTVFAQERPDSAQSVRERYTKQEHRVPMRDGVRLFTAVYAPKDTSQKYPILLMRTPYSVGPYGADRYRGSLGPNRHFTQAGYIFVYQDVRGCYLSEGTFVDMRPHRP